MKKALKKSFSMFFPPPPTTNTSISKKSISGPIGVTKITQSESSASLLATAYSIGPKIEYQTEINELTTSDNNMVQSDAFPVTDGMSFENAAAFKEKINEVGVVTIMQCIDDKDYTAAMKIGIEIIFRPGVSRYNLGIAHLGVAKAVLAKLKLPGKLDFDRREVKYDVEENLNLSLGNFRLASSEPCGLEDVDKEEFNKYFAEATDMLNEIRRREAWKRGVVWQEPKNESEGSPLDFNQN